MRLQAILESILFVAEEPIAATELAEVTEVPLADIEAQLQELARELIEAERGIVLRNVAGGWRMYSDPATHSYLERFAQTETAVRISKAAMEALAVVAYRQPVSRGQVSELRGVDSEQALRTLERRGLIAAIGTAPGPGKALLYGTTALFLEKLGMSSLGDLPPVADYVPPASMVEELDAAARPEAFPSNGSTN